VFTFHVVSGTVAKDIITGSRPRIVDQVREAYLLHHAGDSLNPKSYFLRFPAKPEARIIALPAYLGGDSDVAGLKWIGSFPGNIDRDIPRASAVLLLNDFETGYPFACLEAAEISAARTAASATLAAEALSDGGARRTAGRVAFVGAGVIARTIADFFTARGWTFGQCLVHDRISDYADALAAHLRRDGHRAQTSDDVSSTVADADLVVLATTAAEPYLTQPGTFAPGQLVLNISLRDLGPDLILEAYNVVDDVDHCLSANTSPHLAEQQRGSRDFVDGTLAGVLRSEVAIGTDRPVIFSPFGLGVLDLAVGFRVYRSAVESGMAIGFDDFFGDTRRWSR
jgi:2,3-diaminopropionate biosynthesis protein SbnB